MSIFDLEDGDFIFGSGDTGFDSDGHMMSRMSDNMALDLDTGEIHMVSGWDDDDECLSSFFIAIVTMQNLSLLPHKNSQTCPCHF